MTDGCERIFRDPEFCGWRRRAIASPRRLLATLAIFLALLILVAFCPPVLAAPLGPGRASTLADA